MMRVAIRGFGDGKLLFTDLALFEFKNVEAVLSIMVPKHIAAVADYERHTIEIEFLDEPDPNERFFRFGTDPDAILPGHRPRAEMN